MREVVVEIVDVVPDELDYGFDGFVHPVFLSSCLAARDGLGFDRPDQRDAGEFAGLIKSLYVE